MEQFYAAVIVVIICGIVMYVESRLKSYSINIRKQSLKELKKIQTTWNNTFILLIVILIICYVLSLLKIAFILSILAIAFLIAILDLWQMIFNFDGGKK
jgi:ABC-type Fe3+ transport system permease subunit